MNDNPPTFLDTPYTGAVLENASLGMTVMRVTAVDKDEVIRSSTYSLTSLFRTRFIPTQTDYLSSVFFSHLLSAISNPCYFELFFVSLEGLKKRGSTVVSPRVLGGVFFSPCMLCMCRPKGCVYFSS